VADERIKEKAIEGLLARRRAWPAASQDASACPAPDILAAYFERSLATDELSRWEEHFAACPRCQESLALLVKAGPAPEPVLQPRPSAPFAWLWNWRWLAPVAAAAIVFAVWVAVQPGPETPPRVADLRVIQPAPPPSTMTEEVAKPAQEPARPPVEPAAVAASRAAQPSAAGAAPTPSQQIAIAELPAASERVPQQADAARPHAASEPALIAQEKDKLAKVAEEPKAERLEPARSELVAQQVAREVRGGGIAPMQHASEMKRQAAQAPKGPAPAANAIMREQAGVPAGQKAEQPPGLPLDADLLDLRATEATGFVTSRMRRDAGYLLISSAQPGVFWRFGRLGDIAISTDGGHTWHAQQSPADARILTGFSPAKNVCWAAGRAGVILLTTDGRTWTSLPSPVTEDIVMLHAADASSATIRSASGRVFLTRDAGKSWEEVK
jgi:hypothetical protein